MKILALESSAVSASVALTEDEKLVAQSFQNCGLTHSRTLLPMVENLLANCGVSLADVDAIAVAHGPGSFTGVRIGVATVKGLALGADKPCLGVSTLEAMAWGARALGGDLCCVMDARAGQVYNALFTVEDGRVRRLCDDRAIKLTELADQFFIVFSAYLKIGVEVKACGSGGKGDNVAFLGIAVGGGNRFLHAVYKNYFRFAVIVRVVLQRGGNLGRGGSA